VVEYTFGLPIDYYAVVDWLAFADVIDALGGVWINVPYEMRNVQGSNPRTGHSFKLTFKPGYQYMDAIGALAYARHRDDDENDFGRIRRQQEVMRSAADEALRGGWLSSAPKLYDRFKSAVNTNFTSARLLPCCSPSRSVSRT
jgi:LCP family protein required for cell wall assembly